MDVTLGSLWGESLELLESLGWLDESSEEEDGQSSEQDTGLTRTATTPGSMRNRGMPYFEEMVEDSRLGKIKRRRGGHTSADGNTVEWEVTEMEGDENDTIMKEVVEGSASAETGNGNKRLKLGD